LYLLVIFYTQQERAHSRRLHPSEAARPALMSRAAHAVESKAVVRIEVAVSPRRCLGAALWSSSCASRRPTPVFACFCRIRKHAPHPGICLFLQEPQARRALPPAKPGGASPKMNKTSEEHRRFEAVPTYRYATLAVALRSCMRFQLFGR
jgi:hypothetical protein